MAVAENAQALDDSWLNVGTSSDNYIGDGLPDQVRDRIPGLRLFRAAGLDGKVQGASLIAPDAGTAYQIWVAMADGPWWTVRVGNSVRLGTGAGDTDVLAPIVEAMVSTQPTPQIDLSPMGQSSILAGVFSDTAACRAFAAAAPSGPAPYILSCTTPRVFSHGTTDEHRTGLPKLEQVMERGGQYVSVRYGAQAEIQLADDDDWVATLRQLRAVGWEGEIDVMLLADGGRVDLRSTMTGSAVDPKIRERGDAEDSEEIGQRLIEAWNASAG